jgi:hypothetical protein
MEFCKEGPPVHEVPAPPSGRAQVRVRAGVRARDARGSARMLGKQAPVCGQARARTEECARVFACVFGPCLDYCGTTVEPCLHHVWATIRPCVGHVWTMRGPYVGHIWAMFGPCLGHVRAVFGPCLDHVWAVVGPCFCHVGTMFFYQGLTYMHWYIGQGPVISPLIVEQSFWKRDLACFW